MKIHQQFDINFNDIPRTINEIPILVEKLIKELLEKGYDVVKEGAYSAGIPQNITIIKEVTGPLVIQFSEKTKEDFNAISKALGIEKLFE